MRQLKARELHEHDVVLLTPGTTWVVTTEVEIIGPLATFRARMDKGGGEWAQSQGLALPVDMMLDVPHAWRTVMVPCMICRNTYPHRMDIAVVSEARGICGPCNSRTTAEVERERTP